jgi:hypothetical protein
VGEVQDGEHVEQSSWRTDGQLGSVETSLAETKASTERVGHEGRTLLESKLVFVENGTGCVNWRNR